MVCDAISRATSHLHRSSPTLFFSRLTFSNQKMDAPRAVASSFTKRRMKLLAPFVNSKTLSSMAGASWSVKIVNRAVVVIIFMVNSEGVEGRPFKATIFAGDFSNSTTVLDSCPAHPPRKGVKSTWEISHGTQVGASSRTSSVSVEKSNGLR